MVLFGYSEKLQKKPTGLGRAGFVPASDASNRIAGGLDSDEPGFIYFLIHLSIYIEILKKLDLVAI